LALGLLIDPEVGISYEVAQILATSKPLVDIYRLVDDWLPEHRDGGVEAGALVSRIRRVKPSSAQTVSLSAGFRDSDLFHRHRLPDEMIADGRKRYNIAPAQEPRRKYST
jgi:hypothetical protein